MTERSRQQLIADQRAIFNSRFGGWVQFPIDGKCYGDEGDPPAVPAAWQRGGGTVGSRSVEVDGCDARRDPAALADHGLEQAGGIAFRQRCAGQFPRHALTKPLGKCLVVENQLGEDL